LLLLFRLLRSLLLLLLLGMYRPDLQHQLDISR
jgi:hypothetical protein